MWMNHILSALVKRRALYEVSSSGSARGGGGAVVSVQGGMMIPPCTSAAGSPRRDRCVLLVCTRGDEGPARARESNSVRGRPRAGTVRFVDADVVVLSSGMSFEG